jgi:hypothetical protein
VGEKKSRAGSGKPDKAAPISSHRFFPAIVALWFAALFGLGSLVLPSVLLDEAASASHIGALVPAMAPPLGVKARMLIALTASIVGALAGLWLARKVAMAQSDAPLRRRDPATSQQQSRHDLFAEPAVRRPLSASEELDLASFDSDVRLAGDDGRSRRRSLTTSDEGGLSEWLRPMSVALPGESEDHHRAPLAQLHGTRADRRSEELELDGFAESEPEIALEQAQAPFAAPEQPMPKLFEPVPVEQPQVIAEPASQWQATVAEQSPSFAPPASAEPVRAVLPGDRHDLAALDIGELSERLRHAIAARRLRHASAPIIADAPIAEDGGVQSYFAAPRASVAPAAQAPETAADADQPTRFAAQDCLAPLTYASSTPAALRPIDFGAFDADGDDDEDGVAETFTDLSGLRRPESGTPQEAGSLHAPIAPPESFDEEREDDGDDAIEAEEEEDGASYSSLLTMKNPFAAKPDYIRIEEPESEEGTFEPAVVFPGQDARRNQTFATVAEPASFSAAPAPARLFDPVPQTAAVADIGGTAAAPGLDPMETERALRAALASLQKMSGAA